MSERRSTGVVEWFTGACILILVGVAALSLALELLARIWPWLVLVAVVTGGCWVGIAVWRSRRQPW